MTRRRAVYPGSFDPLHNGHLDLIERCLSLFDEVIVAVLQNDHKKALFSSAERVEMIGEQLAPFPTCRVERFSGLLVDFVEKEGACCVVRGLRAVSDFEYEFQMALMNKRLNPRVETLFMMPKEDYTFVSSRTVKEVFFLGGNLDGLVPERILERLEAHRDAHGAAGG
ncbi:MAG: pantetheine-phosphate adenylyltransferase [Acidobacteria bacterium]|nr:pantetheine-phosphate adenylyltransferase [Acidobacteriota bacterium]